jgi:hypothetical protein
MRPRRIWRGHLRAETGPCRRRICSRGRGWSSRFSPPSATSLHSPMRRGRLAGWGRPLHPCQAGVMPAATGTDNAGLHALRLRRHADLNLVGSIGGIANAGSCVSAAGDRAPAHVPAVMRGVVLAFRQCRRAEPGAQGGLRLRPLIPGALDKAAAAAYGVATARPAGPAAAPAGAPECGRGSTAV